MSGSLGNKEIMAENLNYYMKKNNVSRNKLSDDLNISYTTIRDWVKAKTYPRIDKIEILANYFNIDKSDLVEKSYKTDLSIQPIFGKLNPDRQIKVYSFAESQLEEQQEENRNTNNNIVTMPKKIVQGRSTAAGNPIDGDLEDSNTSTLIVEQTSIPNGADEIVTIAGDSMEPTYEDGSQVFIHYQPEVEQGEIAVVAIEGEGVTCKKIYYDWEEGTITLNSINEQYPDREFPMNEVRVIGKVI